MAKSKDKKSENQLDSSLPEGIAPPPPVADLPNPDGLEEPNQQARVNKEKKKRKIILFRSLFSLKIYLKM